MKTVAAERLRSPKKFRRGKPAPNETMTPQLLWTGSVGLEDPDLPEDGNEPAVADDDLPEY